MREPNPGDEYGDAGDGAPGGGLGASRAEHPGVGAGATVLTQQSAAPPTSHGSLGDQEEAAQPHAGGRASGPVGAGAATPTAANMSAASQALKDAAAARQAASRSSQKPRDQYKPKNPVNWTPASFTPISGPKFELGSAGNVKPLSTKEANAIQAIRLPTGLVVRSVDGIDAIAKLRTDNANPHAAPALVWKSAGDAAAVKRTLPEDLGKKMDAVTQQSTPTTKSNGRGRRGQKNGRHASTARTAATESTKTAPTSPAPTPKEADNVWKRAQEVLLKNRTAQSSAPDAPDEVKYAEHYAVARRRDYRTIPDKYQREKLPIEEETLFLWRKQIIFLAEPPRFITETHTFAERLFLRQLHRRMRYKLYVSTPPQLKWPAATAKFHFCSALIDKNHADEEDRVLDLIGDIHVFSCSPESRMAVLHFVRPDKRDQWTDATFKFPFGQIALRATDTLDQDDKKSGLDEAGLDLLYPIHLLGRPEMRLTDARAIATELCGGLPILDIYELEATGERTLETHEWKIILHGTDAPPGIARLRCLHVTQGDVTFTIGVHQPRLAKFHPCVICLGIGHFRNQCKHKGNQERLDKIRPQFERALTIPVVEEYEPEPMAETLEEHREQMRREREALAPELAAKEAALAAKRAADALAEQKAIAAAIAQATAEREALEAQAAQKLRDEAKEAAQKLRKERRKAKAKGTPTQKLSAALNKVHVKMKSKKPAKGHSKPTVMPPSSMVMPTWETFTAKIQHKPRKSKVLVPAAADQRWRTDVSGTDETPDVGAKRKWDEDLLPRSMDVFEDTPMEEDGDVQDRQTRFLKADQDGTRVAGGGSKLEQAMVTTFFQPTEHPGDAPASDDSSVQLLGVVPATHRPVHARALVAGAGMSMVDTPMNGSCLLHALLGATSVTCGSRIDARDVVERAAALRLRKDLYDQLCARLRPLIDVGSLKLREMVTMYLGPEASDKDEDEQYSLLLAHFRRAGRLGSLDVTREYWGGEAEITAFVEWKGESMYVFDVLPSGETHIVRYELADMPIEGGLTTKRVYRVHTNPPMFRAQLAIYKSQRVIPLVLMCHHTMVDGPMGQAVAHFNAARVSNKDYAAWASNDEKRTAMKGRLNRVEALILNLTEGGSAAVPSNDVAPPSSGGSEWQPGDSEAGSSDGSSLAPAPRPTPPFSTDISSIASAPPADGSSVDSTPRGTAIEILSPADTPIEPELSAILSSQPDPGLSHSAIEKFLPASYASDQGPVSSTEEEELLLELKRSRISNSKARNILSKVDRATATAFAEWVRRQAKANPQAYDVVKKHATAVKACEAVQDRPDVLRALLRAMPYPEVVVAQLHSDVLLRAGRHIICEARVQLLYRLRDHLHPDGAKFCREWALAIASTHDLDLKWNVAHDAGRWKRLKGHGDVAKLAQPIPSRLPGKAELAHWVRLVAFLLVVPGMVPVYFQSSGLPMQSDALLVWMSRRENAAVVKTAATALAQRCWLEIVAVPRHWSSSGSSLSTSVAAAHTSAGSNGVARY